MNRLTSAGSVTEPTSCPDHETIDGGCARCIEVAANTLGLDLTRRSTTPLCCYCCGVLLEAADVDFALNDKGLDAFDGHCRDCWPNGCPSCD